MKEIEDNEKLYKKLEKDRKNKKLKKDKSEIEKLLKKGAANEDFFVIYMDYLIETKQKDKAKNILMLIRIGMGRYRISWVRMILKGLKRN